MIPNKGSIFYKISKYSILENGDIIEKGDQYYNPMKDKWLPVEEEFIGQEWDSDHSKPVRRKTCKK